MKILALDTATENCSAALWLDGVVSAVEEETARDHANLILGMVDGLLAGAALPLTRLDAIAFGRGPGSFTGVRLAAAVTQGLAFSAGLPVVPVSDLRALAWRALSLAPAAQRAVCCADARMGEVYHACYRRDADFGAVLAAAESAEAVLPPDQVRMTATPGLATVAVGRGLRAYPVLRERAAALGFAVHDALLPRASDIVALAAFDAAAGRTVPAAQAQPEYLRNRVVTPPS